MSVASKRKYVHMKGFSFFFFHIQNHTPLNIKSSFCADISSLIEFPANIMKIGEEEKTTK